MKKAGSLLLVALVALVSSGCRHVRLKGAADAGGLPAEIAREYESLPCLACPVTIQQTADRGDYTISRVQLQSARLSNGTNRWIEIDYYRPASAGAIAAPAPVIMVLPMLGGSYELERHFAGFFASRGYVAAIVRRDRRQKEMMIEELDLLMRQMVLDHRQVVDWFETRPEIDPSRLGIFGVSMGGIKGALLVALEPRIRAAAIGLAGGDLPYIITRSTESGLAKRREQELKTRNITLEESERQLREIITCDPIRYAAYVDPRKVMLVLANNDTVVPIEKGLELKEKMGHPETIFIPGGHYTAVLAIPYIKSRSLAFFVERFNETGQQPRIPVARVSPGRPAATQR